MTYMCAKEFSKKRKKGKSYLTENRLVRNDMCAGDNHSHMYDICAKRFLYSNLS